MNVPAYPGIVQEQFPGESSQPQHYDNETIFGKGQSSAEFPFHDTTFRGSASQLHNELIEEEREGLDEEMDEGSESSLEDVDAALEADGFEDDYIDGQGNLFSSKDELQCAMKKFCMIRNYVVKTDKSSPNLLSYKCNNKTSCGWRLRASIKPNSDMWKVTKYTGPHSCLAVNVTQDHSMLDARYMANEMTEIIGSNFSMKIKTLQLFIKKLTEGYMPS
ncbi:hypothetical protein RHGRI_001296 [Rhododendron griersonianum]|uniref:Transposase MuDR plant domain-containing protein n=1 Tax=Rhododendron griersonianum TaxID=479676 RepID=A0AAV6LJN9_9ERIC|nr:hypothetical protein RHGRI_001296 [Rhododendron griersonianum]